MGYLVQKTRVASLTIGGVDYTSSLVSFGVSDSSAKRDGLVTTTGSVVLGQRPGQADIEDYDRNLFKRGTEVVLDLTTPGGSSYRHPRGLLYVISVSYDVEAEELELEVGCKITLMQLNDNPDPILSLVPIYLDPAQRTIQNCSASFASAGQLLYQDNQGNLVSRKFFGNDGLSGVEAGEWVSVLGVTALKAEPLGASDPIPDEISLSYQVPVGDVAGNSSGKVDTVIETSRYFVNYPATAYERIGPTGDNGESNFDTSVSIPIRISGSRLTSGCGNTPTPPSTVANVTVDLDPGVQNVTSCQSNFTTNRVDVYLPATRVATSETRYSGPGGQVDYTKQTVEGPAVEANSGYYADKYAYCTAVYGYGCNPGGNCPYDGMNTVTLSYTETRNEYDPIDNSLVRTVTDTYANLLSAYQTSDYRSGSVNGVPQGFDGSLPENRMYRASRTITESSQQSNTTVQLTTTFTSVTSRGVGVSAGVSLDALDGIRTSVRRESTTTSSLELRPDTINSPTTSTETKSKTILLPTAYETPPTEAGPYVLEESIPVPLLSTDSAEVDGWVADYSHYITAFIKGDLYGLRIAEAMREEIVDSWYPGMPFRYVDTSNGKVMGMRMDACVWGVTQDEAIVVTNGVWTGDSGGTLNYGGSNLVGNSAPDLSGNTPTPPPAVDTPPSIDNDLIGSSYSFSVNVDLWIEGSMFVYGQSGVFPPNPTDLTAAVEMTLVPFVRGIVATPGSLLETTGTGSIPVEYGGNLVTDLDSVVTPDLFG